MKTTETISKTVVKSKGKLFKKENEFLKFTPGQLAEKEEK